MPPPRQRERIDERGIDRRRTRQSGTLELGVEECHVERRVVDDPRGTVRELGEFRGDVRIDVDYF